MKKEKKLNKKANCKTFDVNSNAFNKHWKGSLKGVDSTPQKIDVTDWKYISKCTQNHGFFIL